MPIPHDLLTQAPIHVNYRLFGSIPMDKAEILACQRDQKLSMLEELVIGLPQHLRKRERDIRALRIHGEFELAIEKALHDHWPNTYLHPEFGTLFGIANS